MDDHISAVITIIGMTCDVMGGLYLAYDLWVERTGPLARLTKIVNYSVLLVLAVPNDNGFKFAPSLELLLVLALGLHFDRAAATFLIPRSFYWAPQFCAAWQ